MVQTSLRYNFEIFNLSSIDSRERERERKEKSEKPIYGKDDFLCLVNRF